MIDVSETSPEDWKKEFKGDPGQSPYDIACELGFTGTKAEWLETLKLKFSDLTEEEINIIRGPAVWRDQ